MEEKKECNIHIPRIVIANEKNAISQLLGIEKFIWIELHLGIAQLSPNIKTNDKTNISLEY